MKSCAPGESRGDGGGRALKTFAKVQACVLLAAIGVGCAKQDESVNRRRFAPSEDATLATDNEGGSDAELETVYATPNFVESKHTSLLDPIFMSNIQLASKTKADEIILFGKDGNSWVYKPGGEGQITAISPAVVNPEGSTLYSLNDQQFWIVSPEEIGKRKTGAASDQGAVTIERFGTDAFPGNKDKIAVLFAGPTEIILHLETYLVILTTESGKPSFNQFALASLPVDLGGQVLAAGRSGSKGFWLANKDTFALLEPRGTGFSWTKVHLPLSGLEDYRMFAAWLDTEAKAAQGSALILHGEKMLEKE